MPGMIKRTVSTLVCAAVLILCPGGQCAAGQEIFVVRTFPGEGETLVRRDFQVIVEFSGRAEPEEFSFSISPDPGGWQKTWENGNRRVKLTTPAGFARGTRYEARVKAEKEGKEHVFSFFVSGPDSVALIDEAEEKKILTRDEAWLHRMEALFEPEKLPEAYRSSTPIRCGTPVFNRFSRDSGSLEKETLERLGPYLLRPGEPGSVFEGDGDDEEVSGSFSASPAEAVKRPSGYSYSAKCSRAPITVWSGRKNAAKARRARDLVDSHDMYSRFKSLMGKEPPRDGGSAENRKNPDDRLDIFMVRMDASAGSVCGFCRATSLGKKVSPSVILTNNTLEGDLLASTLAHELFHAFQNAHSVFEEKWLSEGTAVWAEDFIGSGWNTEQDYLPALFAPDRNRMETLTSKDGDQPYAAYLFPFFLTKHAFRSRGSGADAIVGDIWKAAGADGDFQSLGSVNHALKGKFDKYFREFALVTMDLPPFDEIYPKSENLEIRPLHREEFWLLYEPGEQTVEIPLPPLSAKYIRIDNDLFDPAFVRLDLSDFLKNPDTLSVQAVIDDGEKLPPLDLTGKEKMEFEVNREEKSPLDFKKIILVFASTDRKSTTFNTLKIQVRGAKFSGTVFYRKNHPWSAESSNATGTVTSTGTLTENAALHITLKYSNTYQGRDYYKPEDASGTYSYSYREHCEIRVHDQPGVGTIDRTAGDSGALKRERIHCLLIHDPEKGTYSFDFSISTPVKESGTEIWHGGLINVPFSWGIDVPSREYEGQTDGSIFSDSWSVPGNNAAPVVPGGHSGVHASWTFTKP